MKQNKNIAMKQNNIELNSYEFWWNEIANSLLYLL